MITWTQPDPPGFTDYWDGEAGFWILAKTTFGLLTQPVVRRYVLMNGDHELGTYDTLAEAQAEAEPFVEVEP